jgi:hypothetical protein
MEMVLIEEEFAGEAVRQDPELSFYLFNEETMIKIILRCKEAGYMIIGIESFRIEGKSIQPFMAHSIDYLFSEYGSKRIGCWDEATEFIKSKHQYGLVFDVFYLIPDETVRDALPDLMSMPKDGINDWIIRNRKSNVKFIEEYSDNVEAGKTIRFRIDGGNIGDRVKRNTPMEIVISKGKIPLA